MLGPLNKDNYDMKKISALIIALTVFGSTVCAEAMGLKKSDKIMALGKVLKVDEQLLDDGKGILDFWYVAFENSLYYCITTRGVDLYIECYDKNSKSAKK